MASSNGHCGLSGESLHCQICRTDGFGSLFQLTQHFFNFHKDQISATDTQLALLLPKKSPGKKTGLNKNRGQKRSKRPSTSDMDIDIDKFCKKIKTLKPLTKQEPNPEIQSHASGSSSTKSSSGSVACSMRVVDCKRWVKELAKKIKDDKEAKNHNSAVKTTQNINCPANKGQRKFPATVNTSENLPKKDQKHNEECETGMSKKQPVGCSKPGKTVQNPSRQNRNKNENITEKVGQVGVTVKDTTLASRRDIDTAGEASMDCTITSKAPFAKAPTTKDVNAKALSIEDSTTKAPTPKYFATPIEAENVKVVHVHQSNKKNPLDKTKYAPKKVPKASKHDRRINVSKEASQKLHLEAGQVVTEPIQRVKATDDLRVDKTLKEEPVELTQPSSQAQPDEQQCNVCFRKLESPLYLFLHKIHYHENESIAPAEPATLAAIDDQDADPSGTERGIDPDIISAPRTGPGSSPMSQECGVCGLCFSSQSEMISHYYSEHTSSA